jgi:hypothetical protein
MSWSSIIRIGSRRSKSQAGKRYYQYEEDGEVRCTCPGFRFKNKCVHLASFRMQTYRDSKDVARAAIARAKARRER